MTAPKKRILLAVQGEGRGHLTQAITVQNILTEAGYEICTVLVGTSSAREIPVFFYQQIKAPVIRFASPNFITDAKHKSIKIVPSVIRTLAQLPLYIRNMRMVSRQLKTLKPDMVINFYDPLIGLFYMFFNPGVPLMCIAHQYVYNHPDFHFPKEVPFHEKLYLSVFSELTSARAAKRLALSIYPLKASPKGNIAVVPPILRKAVFEQPVSHGNYILVYLLNEGYMEEIIAWHKRNPETELHCFTDKKDIKDVWQYDENLAFHQINDKKFLELMAGCRAFASTAGFESVCEAMYFGKPTLMVPVAGHAEQFSNSRDAAKAGAGIYDSEFNLDRLLRYINENQTDRTAFRKWVESSENNVLNNIRLILPEAEEDAEEEVRALEELVSYN